MIKFAMACGVGASLRVLQRRAADVTKLVLPFTPDDVLTELAAHKAAHPSSTSSRCTSSRSAASPRPPATATSSAGFMPARRLPWPERALTWAVRRATSRPERTDPPPWEPA